ncbi:MAG TPA: c-type cytochrome [Bryobacteraceae bacterium]|nr:c-type cytochrome [Bryobacteraceae bacterium]
MFKFRPAGASVALLASSVCAAFAQIPTSSGAKATIVGSPAAITASKQNPEAVDRGGQLFAAKCGGCHGATAKGTQKAPDLVRSLLLLDDEKGNLVAPVIRSGRPDKGMPKLNLSEDQISDIVSWLHVQTFAADHRNTYVFLDALTGDPKKGEAYFNGAGKCNSCHSPTGDLKGIGGKYDAHDLQGHWLMPRSLGRGGRGGSPSRSAVTVTVTTADAKTYSGVMERLDDFNVAFRDASGDYHSFDRHGDVPKVVVNNPLKAHLDMLRQYADADIHNVTAYLETLK